MPKIALGVPHLRDLPGYFFDTVLSLEWPPGTKAVRVEGKPVDIARNAIVRSALKDDDVEWVFFLDADMRVHPETLRRLLRDVERLPEAYIVSGTYFARTDTPMPHVYRFTRTDDDGINWYTSLAREYAQWAKARVERDDLPNAHCYLESDDDVITCDAVGAGMLLIHRSVFEAIGEPWFESNRETGGGEDFDFCRKAQLAGYAIYADFAVQGDHEARGGFIGHEEFMAAFCIGTPEEFDFAGPLPMTIAPSGQRRYSPQVAVEFEEVVPA